MTHITKLGATSDLADFQPITMISAMTESLHMILSGQLARVVQVGHMQRGFKQEDGVAANLAILEVVGVAGLDQVSI